MKSLINEGCNGLSKAHTGVGTCPIFPHHLTIGGSNLWQIPLKMQQTPRTGIYQSLMCDGLSMCVYIYIYWIWREYHLLFLMLGSCIHIYIYVYVYVYIYPIYPPSLFILNWRSYPSENGDLLWGLMMFNRVSMVI